MARIAGSMVVSGIVGAALCVLPAHSGEPAASRAAKPNPLAVVLVDVSQIFQNLPQFKAQMKEVQAETEAVQREIKRKEEIVKQIQDELSRNPSEADAKRMEDQLTAVRGEVAVQIELQKRDFQRRQAAIYHETYTAIQDQLRAYAKMHKVRIVLRFNGDAVDKGQPQSVLSYINRPVVWYEPENDITPVILKNMLDKPQ